MAAVQVVVRENRFGTAAARFVPAVARHKQAAVATGVRVAQASSRVRTGAMRAGWTADDNGFHNDVSYTIYNEFGTYKMSAQPMARPGAAAMSQDFLAKITGLAGEIV